MHPGLERDIGISDGSGEQLANSAEIKRIGGRDAASLCDEILELFEDGILQDRINDQNQRGQNTREQSSDSTFL